MSPYVDYDSDLTTTTQSTTGVFIAKGSITVPAEDATFVIEGTMSIETTNQNTRPSTRLFNSTDVSDLGYVWTVDFEAAVETATAYIRAEFIQTAAAGAKVIEYQFEKIGGGGTLSANNSLVTLTRVP